MERALHTIEAYAHFCRASGLAVEDVLAVATSAIRDATNREEFLGRAVEVSGLPVRVLSREEEARYGYLAAVNSTTLVDGAMLDLGGGSVQLVGVAGRAARELGSWPLGAVRMTERFLPGEDPATKKQLKALRAHVRETLAEGAGWLPATGERLVGIGGTVRNLAAAAQRRAQLPSFGVQGFLLTRETPAETVAELAGMTPAQRPDLPGIKGHGAPPRARPVPGPQRRPAGLQPAGARPGRPGRALSPQGLAGVRRARAPDALGRRWAARPLRGAAPDGRAAGAQPRPAGPRGA